MSPLEQLAADEQREQPWEATRAFVWALAACLAFWALLGGVAWLVVVALT